MMTTHTEVAATSEPTETSAINTSRIPHMVLVDEEGLEEQFLMGDEASQDLMDVTANRVTMPVDDNDAAPLNPIYTQRSQHDEDLDLQPSRGPRDESFADALDQFLDDNFEDVLRTSNIEPNFSISGSTRNITARLTLPLGWMVPDGTNQTLEDIRDKKISNGILPGGGQAGAMVVSLQSLEPCYGPQFFLINLETGEVFAYVQQQWRCAGLYCSSKPFSVNELMLKVEHHGHSMRAELEAEQQTPLIHIRRTPSRFEVPPSLPAMDETDIHVLHQMPWKRT